MGALRLLGLRDIDRALAQRVGTRAGRLCRVEGREIKRVSDATFGTLNIYPRDVVRRAAEESLAAEEPVLASDD
jgi:hypothetical protein